MSTSALSHLISETKKWIENTYYGQNMIHIGNSQISSAGRIVAEESSKKSLGDFLDLKGLIKVEVITLIMSDQIDELSLVERLTQAIDRRIAKALVIRVSAIEKHNLWKELITCASSLRHILISEIELYKLPNLLKLYQTKPTRTVLNKPLFLLADLECYNRDVSLKKSLWETLLSEL